MKKISFLVAFIAFTAVSFAQSWKSDPAHSRLGFTITHLGINDVSGYFGKFDATINSSSPDLSDATIELTVDASSINTGIEMRDNHLKSADFFDVAKNPSITFKSTSVKKNGANKFTISGNLTMNGVTKPVTLDAVFRGTAKNPAANNATVAGVQFTTTIKRSDFGIGQKFPAPMLSDEIKIKADGEFVQK